MIAAVLIEVGHGRLTKERMMKAVQTAARDTFPGEHAQKLNCRLVCAANCTRDGLKVPLLSC